MTCMIKLEKIYAKVKKRWDHSLLQGERRGGGKQKETGCNTENFGQRASRGRVCVDVTKFNLLSTMLLC